MSQTVLNERAEIFANRAVINLLIRHLSLSYPHLVAELRILAERSLFRPAMEHPSALMPPDPMVRERVKEILADCEPA